MAHNASSPATNRHALHWVLKVSDREAIVKFLRNVLGMRVLRHEEFEKGCDAACNGPYDGRWSKTMIGYGPESKYFVLELTYNYGIGSYDYRHDYLGMTIVSQKVYDKVKASGYACEKIANGNGLKLTAPDGYPFFVHPASPSRSDSTFDPVHNISISVSDLAKSTDFWTNVLGMRPVSSTQNDSPPVGEKNHKIMLTFAGGKNNSEQQQCNLELVQAPQQHATIDHGTAFGRIAFMCPKAQQADIERRVREDSARGSGARIHTPLISLDTPGKATVEVVIVCDPDGYEICFVGSEAFKQLCQVDPQADRLLDEAIAKDDSKAWYEKKGKIKSSAE